MIAPEHERTRNGERSDFFDALSFDFCDGERDLFGLVRVIRHPNAARTSAVVLSFAGGELIAQETLEQPRAIESWEQASIDGVTIETHAPLERFGVTVSAGGIALELEANAVSAPVSPDGDRSAIFAEATGVEQYEQICDVHGQALVGGTRHELRCYGRRLHSWGCRDWSRVEAFRSLYAVSDAGGAIAAASARPTGALGHGDDVRAAHLIAGPQPALAFQEVRISTIFGPDALPAKAGLELYEEESEFPRRVAGVKACGASVGVRDERLMIAFMRWSMEARTALGCYEIIERS